MSVSRIILTVILATVAGSYTWGMRGTILGGERGALLPGAALGLILAFTTDSPVVRSAFAVFAVAGAASMFFGGAQTYGQTIGMTYDKENVKRRHRGRIGLAIKGATWFGIFGGTMAVCFGAAAGRYSVLEICLLVALMPVAKWIGFFVFNYPQKPKEGKLPKLYFSDDRFEIWGGMVFVNLLLIVFSVIKGEWFVPIMTLAGLVGGGLGFFVGNLLQTGSSQERENGKYIFGALQKKGFVESWKTMEFTLGAFGGLFVSLFFCLFFNKFVNGYVTDILANSGVWSPLSEVTQKVLGFVWLAMLILFTLKSSFMQNMSEKLKKISEDSDEILIWPLFSYIPLLLALLGDTFATELSAFFLIFWVLAEEILFTDSQKNNFPKIEWVRSVLGAVSLIILAVQLFTEYKFSALQTFIMYSVAYEVAELYSTFSPLAISADGGKKMKLKKSLISMKEGLTVRIYSVACVAAMLIIGVGYFAANV